MLAIPVIFSSTSAAFFDSAWRSSSWTSIEVWMLDTPTSHPSGIRKEMLILYRVIQYTYIHLYIYVNFFLIKWSQIQASFGYGLKLVCIGPGWTKAGFLRCRKGMMSMRRMRSMGMRTAMKMMSWRRIQQRRKEDADDTEDDQQDEDVRLMKLMKMRGWWGSGGWIEPHEPL